MTDRYVIVFGRKEFGKQVAREVSGCVVRHSFEDRIPHVPVHIDEPREDNGVRGIDDCRACRCFDAVAHCDDDAVVDEHITDGEVCDSGVHRHDVPPRMRYVPRSMFWKVSVFMS